MSLSLLCRTKVEPHASHFLVLMSILAERLDAEFVVAVDGRAAMAYVDAVQLSQRDHVVHVRAREDALAHCHGEYVLQLNDDECCSPAMVEWLMAEAYHESECWEFPRVHLWPDVETVLMTPPLFPDYQMRMYRYSQLVSRKAPVAIEHHKFLVKSYAERYDQMMQCANKECAPFILPESVFQRVTVVSYGDGEVPWQPLWHKEVELRPKT